MTRIAVLDDWQGLAEREADWSTLKAKAEVVFFKDHLAQEDALVARLAEFDAVMAMRERTRLTASVLGRLGRLRMIAYTGARNASVDTEAATKLGILVCNTTGSRPSHGTPELALALLLAAARQIPLGDSEIRAGRFQDRLPSGIELAGATLGLIGLGRIGGRMARYGTALGMEVLAWSTNLTDARAAEVGAKRVEKLDLLARADAVSLSLVLSERSRHTIGAVELAAMKQGAILVNTSRGGLIDTEALLKVLHAGKIIAALDVYDEEPLPPDAPIRSAPNTVLSPHLGYVTGPGMAEFYKAAAANLVAWLEGAPTNVTNPEAAQHRRA